MPKDWKKPDRYWKKNKNEEKAEEEAEENRGENKRQRNHGFSPGPDATNDQQGNKRADRQGPSRNDPGKQRQDDNNEHIGQKGQQGFHRNEGGVDGNPDGLKQRAEIVDGPTESVIDPAVEGDQGVLEGMHPVQFFFCRHT